MAGQRRAQEARLVDRERGADAQARAQLEGVADVVVGVRVDHADREALGRPVRRCWSSPGRRRRCAGRPRARGSRRARALAPCPSRRRASGTRACRGAAPGSGATRRDSRRRGAAGPAGCRRCARGSRWRPASRQRSASAPISSGLRGTCGFLSGRVSPLMAASITTDRSLRAAHQNSPKLLRSFAETEGAHRTRVGVGPNARIEPRGRRPRPLPEPRAVLARIHARVLAQRRTPSSRCSSA